MLNKKGLAELLRKTATRERMGSYSQKECEWIVDVLFDTLESALMAGEEVNIKSFGKFNRKTIKERNARSTISANSESIVVPAHYKPQFRPSLILRARVKSVPVSTPKEVEPSSQPSTVDETNFAHGLSQASYDQFLGMINWP
jgi:nucleoid DNA-binding protein